MKFINKIKKDVLLYICHTDWLLILACAASSAYGIILLYSVAHTRGSGASDYLIQLAASIVGLIAAIIISKVDYEIICRIWPILAGISLLLVLLTFTPLGLNVSGTDDTAWLSIPIGGDKELTFQPSELMKITFIISFATHLSKVHEKLHEIRTVLMLCIHGAIPIGLIFLQGDDGTALVFVCIFVSMIMLAGLRPIYFLVALIGGTGTIPLLWQHLSNDKKARFLSLVFIDQYAGTTGWQQYLGLMAIGSGQLWGVGYLKGGSNHLLYARNNDFIFTVAGEEFGFVGALALLGILLVVVLALLRELMTAKNLQGMLICGGVMAMIGFQSLINIGMNLRLLPVIGITLPFFSRGGSSVATLYLGIGIALSVYYSSRTKVRNAIFSKVTY